jgi:catechol 2,3-dioxygenase-like lactoylglutathione lyase family enzyme
MSPAPAAEKNRGLHVHSDQARPLRDSYQRLGALERVLHDRVRRRTSCAAGRFAYRFGDKQLNVHGPGVRPAEVARIPVAPGNSDLCFEWSGPITDAIAHLKRCSVVIECGPIQRFGAKGAGTSIYFRDPDGSLMEFMSYA